MSRAEREAARRQAWMRAFESALLAACPHLAGRIDWTAPAYLYGTGMSADDAAARVASREVAS